MAGLVSSMQFSAFSVNFSGFLMSSHSLLSLTRKAWHSSLLSLKQSEEQVILFIGSEVVIESIFLTFAEAANEFEVTYFLSKNFCIENE